MMNDTTGKIIAKGKTYYSLTNLAKKYSKGQSPGYIIQGWLRGHNTLEFLKIWEHYNNPNFNKEGYEKLSERIKTSSFTLTAKQWLENTGAIGIISSQDKNGATYAQIEIVYDFMCWLSPIFKYDLIGIFHLQELVKNSEENLIIEEQN